MTNRVNALTLVLGEDVREDDIEHLKAAVMQFRNVVAVESNFSNVTDQMDADLIIHECPTCQREAWAYMPRSYSSGCSY